jgi:NSS family neurotransmitter:Na+ symporter
MATAVLTALITTLTIISTFAVSALTVITIIAILVAADGLGSNGFSPAEIFKSGKVLDWNDCWLDFFDCWSEGIMMPLGAMLMAVMIGWEVGPKLTLDEVAHGDPSEAFKKFFTFCIKFVVPIVMAFVLAGQLIGFFGGHDVLFYILSAVILAVFWVFAAMGKKEA